MSFLDRLLHHRIGPVDVVKRVRVLAAQLRLALAFPEPAALRAMHDSARDEYRELALLYGGAQRLEVAALRAANAWGAATSAEREFLKGGVEARTDRRFLDALWGAEALGCCLWALSVLPSMPAYDAQFESDDLGPAQGRGENELVRNGLRPEAELARARDVAELWHWRCRTRQVAEEGTLPRPEGITLDRIVSEAASFASASGDIPAPIDGDFPAFGKAFRALRDDEYQQMSSIARERHKALNWLCGRAPRNRWDQVSTDT